LPTPPPPRFQGVCADPGVAQPSKKHWAQPPSRMPTLIPSLTTRFHFFHSSNFSETQQTISRDRRTVVCTLTVVGSQGRISSFDVYDRDPSLIVSVIAAQSNICQPHYYRARNVKNLTSLFPFVASPTQTQITAEPCRTSSKLLPSTADSTALQITGT